MKIITCCKIVPNEEEINILPDRKLSTTEASLKISQYDLNALEAGKSIAAETEGTMTALSIGSVATLSNTKIRKDILSRGANDLSLVADDAHEFSDSLQSAKAIANALTKQDYDLVLCGAGSSDLYAQAVGIQVGTLLNLPVVNNITSIKVIDTKTLEVERALESEVEVLEISLPAIITISSEINVPSVPSMRDIMKAGKKPVNEITLDETIPASTQTLEQLAPTQQERRQEIIEGDSTDAVDALVQFLKKEVL